MAGGQANMNGVFRPGAPIIVFEPLSQRMSSDANDGIHLWVKRFRAPKRMYRDAVLLDFVDRSFEILFADKCQKSNMVVRAPEYAARQNFVYFSPFGLKSADCRFQVDTPNCGPGDLSPRL
jgi:hypothetical protein